MSNAMGLIDYHGAVTGVECGWRQGKPSSVIQSIEEAPNVFAAVMAQALEDSIPEQFFTPKSRETIFDSFIPDAYDAYDFFTGDRLNIYAEIQGLDPSVCRARWREQWEIWADAYAKPLLANLTAHIIRMLSISKPGTSAHMDAKAFYMGPQFKHFCRIAGADVERMRLHIQEKTLHTIPAAKPSQDFPAGQQQLAFA